MYGDKRLGGMAVVVQVIDSMVVTMCGQAYGLMAAILRCTEDSPADQGAGARHGPGHSELDDPRRYR